MTLSESGALPGPGGDVQRRFLEQGGGNGREDVGGPPQSRRRNPARTRATTASTVPGARMSSFRPRGVSSRSDRRPSPGSRVLRTIPFSSRRWSTPVSVLGCSRRMSASAPAEIPGSAAHDAQRHSLGAGEPDGGLHPLRKGLKAVVERPDQAHEVQYLAKGLLRCARRAHRGNDRTDFNLTSN